MLMTIFISNRKDLERIITYHEFKEGDKLCNKLSNDDCITVSNGGIKITMNGEPKIYVKE